MRNLKYVKLFENFKVNENRTDDDKYESFTNEERELLTTLKFKIVGDGIAQLDSYRIYKHNPNSPEGKNRINLNRGKKGFGEYGQFEVTGEDASFEERSFDSLSDAYNHILRHIRNK